MESRKNPGLGALETLMDTEEKRIQSVMATARHRSPTTTPTSRTRKPPNACKMPCSIAFANSSRILKRRGIAYAVANTASASIAARVFRMPG